MKAITEANQNQEAGECKTPVFKDNKKLKSNDDTFSGAISPDSGSHSDSQGEAKELEECPGDTPTDKTESIPPQKLNLSKLNAQSGSTMASLTSKKDNLEIDFNNFMVIEKRLSGRESPHSKQDYISED
eukprot:CAMPEP_0197003534 /NCGR_PEP_ID=MMETSP1380-20130617/7763_1 /TAXON_ID=5936 /ORGANISM="Euplotes crassus, Strain CT5" /LENGTH=128 /DNA_ID=CAMNT_0042422057 /DNA_START=1 /DNA_END=387 /DNA_ORIENTATION=+